MEEHQQDTSCNAKLQGKRWMLTINNPSFEESERLYNLGHSDYIDCLIYGAEHTEDGQGTPHFQIYVHFKGNWRFNRIKEMFPRARIELAKKPKIACCRYCAKEGFYMSFGNVPDLKCGRGAIAEKRRADELARETVVRKIMKGELKMTDLSAEQLLDMKLLKACKEAASMTQGPMRNDVYTVCFVSPTGWGKSYSIWETFQKVASVEFGGTQEWFLDPEQDVMLFDEFCGQVRAQKMLKYLDCYPISLPIKGGHRPCYWKLIFICSNTSPDNWYMKDDPKTGIKVSSIPDEVRQALYRRIGYPQPTLRGETHVYSDVFTDLISARTEMKKICVELHHRLYPEGVPDEIAQANPDEIQQQHQEIAEHLKRQDTNLHELSMHVVEHEDLDKYTPPTLSDISSLDDN